MDLSSLSIRRRKVWLILGAIIVLCVVGFISFVFSPFSRDQIPETFDGARKAAGGYANAIVSNLSSVSDDINRLQTSYKSGGNSTEALNLIVAATAKYNDARENSILLASQLEIMAREIPSIAPKAAGETALVAISSETSLISKLISHYNEYLGELLVLLRDAFSGNAHNTTKINTLVDLLNKEKDSINQLNDQFAKLMEKFDSYY